MLQYGTDYIDGDVYRCREYDCTLNGASKRFNALFVVARHVTLKDVEKHIAEIGRTNIDQYFKLDYDFYENDNPVFYGYCRLKPLIKRTDACSMFGGNYLGSDDSRFKEFVGGCKYPVPIHDRWEK